MEETKTEYQILLEKKNKSEMISFIIRIVIVILSFLLVALYLLTPISSMAIMNLNGNIYLNNQDVLSLIHHEENDSIYSLDDKEALELLNAHPLIENAKIDITPFTLNVSFDECAPSAKYDEDVYHTLGYKFTNEEYENEIIKSYFEKHQLFLATYISSPEGKNVEVNSKLLLVTALTNKLNKIIHYVDIINEDKTLVFYYYASENLPYVRVKIDINEFSKVSVNKLSSLVNKECIDKLVMTLYKDSSIEIKKMTIGEKEISYYDTNMEYIAKVDSMLFGY